LRIHTSLKKIILLTDYHLKNDDAQENIRRTKYSEHFVRQ